MYSWTPSAIGQLDYDVSTRSAVIATLCSRVDGEPGEKRRLRTTIRTQQLNLRVVPCVGDGSCFFRGLSYICFGTQDNHAIIRQEAVLHVAQNPLLFAATGRASTDVYLDEMLRPIPGEPSNWPDHSEIVAACEVLRLNIRVLSDSTDNWYLTFSSPVPIKHGVLLYTTEEGYEHYSVLIQGHSAPNAVLPDVPLTDSMPRVQVRCTMAKPAQDSDSESSATCSNASAPTRRRYLGREKVDGVHFRCIECGAVTFQDENGRCCFFGVNILSDELMPEIPYAFATLLDAVPGFASNARAINNQCSFVTIGTKSALQDRDPSIKTSWVRPQGIPTMYALKGRTFHYVPGASNRKNRFYMFMSSPCNELFSKLCDPAVKASFEAIALFLRKHNAFATHYRRVSDVAPQPTEIELHLRHPPQNENEPFVLSAHEDDPDVAPIMTYILYPSSGGIQTYTGMQACGESGSYPLLFPLGHGGWHMEEGSVARYRNGHQIRTIHQYVKYMIYQNGARLTRYGSLFQQWLLDQFSRWQSNVFHYMATDERVVKGMKLRLANMKDMDLTKKNAAGKIGRPFAVPKSVPDSAAARRSVARQCLAIIADLGNPHSWITFTCNRSWREVRDYVHCVYPDIEGNQDVRALTDEDLAHIAVRVYWTKFKAFKRLLKRGAFSFGRKVRWMQIVHEFQTRYWPHFHLLCQFHNYNTLNTDERDAMYSARLFWYEECPLAEQFDLTNPKQRRELRKNQVCNCAAHRLHRIVYRQMRHTCKSNWCRLPHLIRKDGTCDKRFPKSAGTPDSQRSFTDGYGFFRARRPYEEDAYVVCYNKMVLLHHADDATPEGIFHAHNHWDEASGAHSVQYVHEYQHKGPDFTDLAVSSAIADPWLEFENYQKCRHIGFCEALMRFLAMHLVENSPSCSEIRIHLPQDTFIVIPANATPSDIAAKMKLAESELLRYFWRNDKLRHLTLSQYYAQYDVCLKKKTKAGFADSPPCNVKSKTAYPRKMLHVASLHGGSDLNVERHCLCLILQEFARTSYEDCRTVKGLVYSTFAEAASALGIFTEHNEFELCLQELVNPNLKLWKALEKDPNSRVPVVGKGFRIRKVFVTMIMNGAAAQRLFNLFAWHMTRDAVLTGKCRDSEHEAWLLEWVREELNKNRLTLDDVGLHDPDPRDQREAKVRAIELGRVSQAVLSTWIERIALLDVTQRAVFDAVVCAVLHPGERRLFYINARAGCGKTFLCQCISAYLRSLSRIVLTSAPSALAASLHMSGTTCHKCFGLPVTDDRNKSRTSLLTSRSYQGTACAISDLIIIDEISMFDNLYLESVCALLQEVTGCSLPFGGKVLLTAGEFAQLPPVVNRGNREDVVKASIISSQYWVLFCKFDLTTRWRHLNDREMQDFSDALGSGFVDGKHHDGFFWSPPLPRAFTVVTNASQALQAYIGVLTFPRKPTTEEHFRQIADSPLYTSIATAYHHREATFLDSAIRSTVHNHLQTESRTYFSQHTTGVDSVCTQKWMSSVDDMQCPEHRLDLFIGCKLRLLRNFNLSLGLCNGTMLLLRGFGDHYLDVQIITPGEFYGNVETLFKFKFEVMHSKTHLEFSRRQFPVRSAFAGTIHRFQGQGVGEKGLLLFDASRTPFCHGQSYVGITRARTCKQVILVLDFAASTANRMMCLRYSELDILPHQITHPSLLTHVQPHSVNAPPIAHDDDLDDLSNVSDVTDPLVGMSTDDDGNPLPVSNDWEFDSE